MIRRFLTLCIVATALACSSFAATYFVNSNRGHDADNGLSPEAPWRTLAKVNGYPFLPGDIISLARGGAWHETLKLSRSGSTRRPITVTAYGRGPRPLILGQAIAIDHNEQSHIVYDNLEIRDSQQGLRLYSWASDVTDVTLQNSLIATRPSHPHPISAGVYASTKTGTLTRIVIRNNYFFPHPNGLENWGIYFASGVTNFRIENNFLSAAGEDAITIWHSSTGTIVRNRGGGNGENTIDVKDSHDILIRSNTAVNDGEYNIVVHQVDPGPETRDIIIRSNQCLGGGQGGTLTAGIALLKAHSTAVIGNRVAQCLGEAILVSDADSVAHNVVRGNVLLHNNLRRSSPPIVKQGPNGTYVGRNTIQP